MRTFTAKYRGTCVNCGGLIEAGEKITKVDGGYEHAETCEGKYDAEAHAEAVYFDRIERADEIRGFHDDPVPF